MKKRIISLLLVLCLCAALLPTAVFAESAASGNAITLSFTGDCDTAHTQTVLLKDYLPTNAVVTRISSSASNIVKSVTHEYTYTDSGTINVENAKFSYTTREQDEPASGSFTVTVSTSNYGDYVFTINITLTGKYLVTLSAERQNALYDGRPHDGYRNLKGTLTTSGKEYTRNYEFAYEKEDGTALSSAPSEIGNYTVTISIPESNANYKHKEILTLSFSILEAGDADAQYQTEANGEWINGTFEQAVENVYAGGTVKLLRNVFLAQTTKLAKKMTITSADKDTPCYIGTNKNEHGYLLNITDEVRLENIIVDGGSKSNITAQRAAISINGGKLTLGSGAVVQNNENIVGNGAGGGVCVISGELNIQGGKISGNQACWGGGVAVMTGAKAQMTSGSIVQNKSTSSENRGGGGVYLSYGDFNLNGGEIAENTAEKYGGGVYIYGGTLTVNDGQIVENHAGTAGGAVFVNLTSNLHLIGGKICNNSATRFAGGVECAPTSNIVIEGSSIVTGNTSGEETNGGIYPDGTHEDGGYYPNITIGTLSDDAAVNFYTWLKRDGFLIACPVEDHTITIKDLSKLSFEDDDFALKLDDSGNLVLTNVGVYQITFDANGGSIKTETAKTAEGKLAVLPTPTRNGYTFDGWFTEPSDGKQVTADDAYTEDTIIYAHWTAKPEEPDQSDNNGIGGLIAILDDMPFVDVKANHYFYDSVKWAYHAGVTGGTDAWHFSPDAGCTRAQIVTFLWRAAGCPSATYLGNFTDVDADDYYATAVAWAVENGITNGTSATTFSPEAVCTRADAVTFLYRAFGRNPNYTVSFSDVPAGAYYADAVAWAAENGVTGGTGNGKFSPADTCSRAQIVTFLYRTLG